MRPMARRALELAAEIAKPFEGLRLEPYHDPVGYPTIGYGHLLSRKPWADLSAWAPISEARAEELLEIDMMKAQRAVWRLVSQPLSDPQEAALIDFTFNCGGGNLEVSTLRKIVNRGDYEGVPTQLRRWAFARGVKLPGLVRRRAAEIEMWQNG